MEIDSRADHYLRGLQAMHGGQLHVFRGMRPQVGEGFGDILRGIWNFVSPIFSQVASSAVTEVARAREQGVGWKEALKSAAAPVAMAATTGTLEQAKRALGGQGRKRKRVYKVGGKKRKSKRFRSSTHKFNF